MNGDCQRFEVWLEAALSGKPADEGAERAAREHRKVCPACRTYEALVRDTDDATWPHAPDDFARQVVLRTSGSPCERARLVVSEALDGPPADLDKTLMESHLEHCADCRAFERVLRELQDVLPTMARITPRREFLAGVLAATADRPPVRERFSPLRWLDAAWHRPRLPLEVGLVGAVVVWLLIALPVSPLHGSGSVALERLRDPGAGVMLAEARARVVGLGNLAWAATTSEGRESMARLRADLTRGRERTEARGVALWRSVRAFARAISAGDGDSALRALTRIAVELGTRVDAPASDPQMTGHETERTKT